MPDVDVGQQGQQQYGYEYCRHVGRCYADAKIVKAESRNKSKTPFSDLVMPRCILFKTKSKTVKAESRGKSRTKNYDMVALGANIDAANPLGEDIFGFRCRR